jgi:hypothetical protein
VAYRGLGRFKSHPAEQKERVERLDRELFGPRKVSRCAV